MTERRPRAMQRAAADLLRWSGTIGRRRYVLVGVAGVAIKQVVDRSLAWCFGLDWNPLSYWLPLGPHPLAGGLLNIDPAPFFVMLCTSLPFICVGVGLTLRRLRDARLPAWLVALFFVPMLNLFLFALLSAVPSRTASESESGGTLPSRPTRPSSGIRGVASTIGVTTLVGLAGTALSVYAFRQYGWSLFVALPFTLGLVASLLRGRAGPHGAGRCVGAALASIGVLAVVLVAFAFEGVICILMAAPIAIVLAVLGALVGHALHARRSLADAQGPATLAVVTLAALAGVERTAPPVPPLFEVTTTVDVAAPPDVVWRHVVAFSPLPPPDELLFRAGVAYPIRADIVGEGVGAVRHCVFSTGTFVEPIEIWDAPRVLRFGVTSNPPPMREWSPFGGIHPPHLDGFLVSHEGEFRLVPRADGGTRLEGTTWYEHGMGPAGYWRIGADAIIHRIHRRVLDHVRRLAEDDVRPP